MSLTQENFVLQNDVVRIGSRPLYRPINYGNSVQNTNPTQDLVPVMRRRRLGPL